MEDDDALDVSGEHSERIVVNSTRICYCLHRSQDLSLPAYVYNRPPCTVQMPKYKL